jgi:hypothetical protein
MKVNRLYVLAMVVTVIVASFVSVLFAETELVKETSTNVIAGKSVTEATTALNAVQNRVNIHNDALEYNNAATENSGGGVPSQPTLTGFKFLYSDPANPSQGVSVIASPDYRGPSGPCIFVSSTPYFNSQTDCHYFLLGDDAVRHSTGSYWNGTTYQPYQEGYNAELKSQIAIVEKGIALYGAGYTDEATRDNLVKVRDYLVCAYNKYSVFTSGSLDTKGTGTIVTRIGDVVTVRNYRTNILLNDYSVDLKTGRVYAVNKSGKTVEVIDKTDARKVLEVIAASISSAAKKEPSSIKQATDASIIKRIGKMMGY